MMIFVTLGSRPDATRISVASLDDATALLDFIAMTETTFTVIIERSN